tara:strand:+ start:160 stop:867 length:708 start_codon:yes stop_codon:yes gene_type:complete
MIKLFLGLICLVFVQVINFTEVYASSNKNIEQFLINREKIWPNWNLAKLQSSNLNQDLIYPEWFEGNWVVKSENLNNNAQETITYKVNFLKNKMNKIVGNRSKNSESIGKEIFGDQLQKVKIDPKSINNQIIYLKDDEYIDSRVTGRNQIFDNDLFFSDEFFIQTNHKNGISRINQVEIMSKFYKCNREVNAITERNNDICGFQYVATYGSRVGELNLKAITTNKYKLTFKSSEM